VRGCSDSFAARTVKGTQVQQQKKYGNSVYIAGDVIMDDDSSATSRTTALWQRRAK
jgi:hypothetical protein